MPVATQGADLTTNPNYLNSGDRPAIQVQTGTSTFETKRAATTWVSVAAVSITAGTPQIVYTPSSGKKFRLMGWILSSGAAGRIIFKRGANTEFARTGLLPASTAVASPAAAGENGYLCPTADEVLRLDVGTGTTTVDGTLFLMEE